MRKIKNVYISGLGAIGSAYASFFYKKEKELVKVIVDKERMERYSKSAVRINDEPFEFSYILPSEAKEPADLILIAVKGHQLEESIVSIKPFIGHDTIIMSLLNGITSEDVLSEHFGKDKLLHAFCVGTDAVREGTSVRFSKPGRIVFGDRYNRKSEKLQYVKAFFDAAGMPYSISDDIMKDIWWKFMMNVGINQTSAILKAPYGVYHRVKEARELMFAASKEVIPLAQKEGINLTEADIADYMDVIGTLAPEGKTSMLQDVEAGRKTEVESFALTVMSLGKKHHIPTPINEVLYRMLRTIEQTYLK